MSKKALTVTLIVLMMAIASCYLYFGSFTIDQSFNLTTQNVNKRQLPQQVELNITVFPIGNNNALVVGFLSISGEHRQFGVGSFYNSSNTVNNEFYRMTCVTKKATDAMIDHSVYIALNPNRTIAHLELLEAYTFYKTQRTESESGIYVPE